MDVLIWQVGREGVASIRFSLLDMTWEMEMEEVFFDEFFVCLRWVKERDLR